MLEGCPAHDNDAVYQRMQAMNLVKHGSDSQLPILDLVITRLEYSELHISRSWSPSDGNR